MMRIVRGEGGGAGTEDDESSEGDIMCANVLDVEELVRMVRVVREGGSRN